MELHYLGTAAAEGCPGIFCDCKNCRSARERGGKEIRTRSGAMIDGTIKIDFSGDAYAQMLRENLDYSKIHSVLITHSHSDHFSLEDLIGCRPPYAHPKEDAPPLTVYGNERIGELLRPYLGRYLAFQRMVPFEPVEVEGYRVTALEAVHMPDEMGKNYPVIFEGKTCYRKEEALFYLIEKDGHSILYAHDTDEFTQADMDFLAGKGIDLISMDCTNGCLELDYIGHMGARENKRMKEKLLANGAADEHTVFVAHHFSHNGLLPYAEMEALLPGFRISYDTMRLNTSGR